MKKQETNNKIKNLLMEHYGLKGTELETEEATEVIEEFTTIFLDENGELTESVSPGVAIAGIYAAAGAATIAGAIIKQAINRSRIKTDAAQTGCQHLKGNAQKICICKGRIKQHKDAIAMLKSNKRLCGKAENDPQECRDKIDAKIQMFEESLHTWENTLKNLYQNEECVNFDKMNKKIILSESSDVAEILAMTKVAGARAVAVTAYLGAVFFAAYEIYRSFAKGAFRKRCWRLMGDTKEVCVNRCRIDACKKAIDELELRKTKCDRTTNPERCTKAIDLKINKYEEKIEKYEERLDAMKYRVENK